MTKISDFRSVFGVLWMACMVKGLMSVASTVCTGEFFTPPWTWLAALLISGWVIVSDWMADPVRKR